MKKTWRDYFSVSSPFTHPRPLEQKRSSCRPLFSEQMCASCRTHFSVQWGQALIALERKRRALFLSLENLSPYLDCAREFRGKVSAPSPRNSTNWLQRDFQTRLKFFLRKWKKLPRRAAKASSKRRACFVLFRCWIDMVQNISIYLFYQHRKLTVFLNKRVSHIILHKARLLFQPCFWQLALTLFFFSVDTRNG